MKVFDKADITVQIPDSVGMGVTVTCEVTIEPTAQATLRKIEIGCFCQETAISRGSSDSYYRKDVHSDNRIMENQVELRPHQPLHYKLSFPLPELSVPTFNGHNHMVNWYIRVRLDVPWWPDTRYKKEFRVLPVYSLQRPGKE
ncbi:MAG: hypothetical protein AB9903_12405 [Vulcanimicrobiota bacterium]